MRRHGRKLRAVAAAGLLAVGVLLAAGAARGVSGSGEAWQVKKVIDNAPDKYAVRAHAHTLGANTKARGHLAVPLYPDRATVWFTDRYTNHTSEYGYGSGTASFQLSAL